MSKNNVAAIFRCLTIVFIIVFCASVYFKSGLGLLLSPFGIFFSFIIAISNEIPEGDNT